jgi:pimeloyl-ACP methyl ester carboxylesterase
MTEIRPFRIAVPDDDLFDLQLRLARTRWPEAECVKDWSQGTPLGYPRQLAAYWADEYDWRAREASLNRFDQFTTEIDGLSTHGWMDCDGHPENVLSRDQLLDNVMLYWLTASGASSARLYWESFKDTRSDRRVELPTGVASFPKEILGSPRRWCEAGYRITRWTDMPRGGHFAAFEQPELFVDDVRAFFATVR